MNEEWLLLNAGSSVSEDWSVNKSNDSMQITLIDCEDCSDCSDNISSCPTDI